MSSNRNRSWRRLSRMISQYWARDSGVISSAQSSSENPMMQLSGVRTSWQTELTNAAFLSSLSWACFVCRSNSFCSRRVRRLPT